MTRRTGRGTLSIRSAMLLRVLDCINAGQYDDQREYMIFGKQLDEILDEAGRLTSEREGSRDDTALREMISDVRTHTGRKLAAHRTSLDKTPALGRVRGLRNLSSAARQALAGLAKDAPSSGADRQSESSELDDLDAFFSHEVLTKLPKIVARALPLDSLDLPAVPQRVRQYFEEAHRCFLYGFRVACAVLCRAILESALEETIDPDGVIKAKLLKGQSYFRALVNNAEKLKDDKPCAFDVKDAGDWAIHDVKRFNKTYAGERFNEVVHNTRKVLIVLYADSG
jgi:hypothetical protein